MPLTAKELFQAGKVREAEKMLTSYLREHPSDTAQRTFLFELLCFEGEYSRAEKQLGVLAGGSVEKETGAIVYYAALHAEKTRHELFEKEAFPSDSATTKAPLKGELNGKPFNDLRDADPDIGARLEVFAAGAYLWLPFEHVSSLEMGAPQRLRDTLWAPALVQTAPSFRGMDLGEVLIPAIYPFSWKHPDEAVWLGRVTDWSVDGDGREYPSGQKILLVDGEEVPFLEVRSLQFFHPAAAPTE
ncbi:type VI secretion system accessory protein TagJ [Acidicapsa acidisoli]|uniref:type VI secretion system accessory protein TagJ n=1 Tax=Acidicapsa acidisoli TaxID=1615681 RepID=UPI0021E0F495|nr:type VI secretion system accessory protein TagJ [Acidicapsa acidisoli]